MDENMGCSSDISVGTCSLLLYGCRIVLVIIGEIKVSDMEQFINKLVNDDFLDKDTKLQMLNNYYKTIECKMEDVIQDKYQFEQNVDHLRVIKNGIDQLSV